MKIIFYALLLSLISHAPVYGKNASFTTASAINARNATHQFLLTAKNAYEIYNPKIGKCAILGSPECTTTPGRPI